MHKYKYWVGGFFLLLMVYSSKAQQDHEKGFELGIFRVTPAVELLGAYDDRVAIGPDGAEDDLYAESVASVDVENTDARYDLGAWASYGYRAYDEYSGLDDDFYGAGGGLASRESPLKWGLSGQFKKTIDFDVRYSEVPGRDLPEYITGDTSERSSARGDLGYELQLSDKTAVLPALKARYYHQDFEDGTRAEWQEYNANLSVGYGLASTMVLTLTGDYEMQINGDDDGSLVGVWLGAQSRGLDKISWKAMIGVVSADYELSGTDESVVGEAELNWKATDKVSFYAFCGNYYRPGFNGGNANMVYRAGYGVNWALLERLRFNAQMLHDYEEDIDSSVVDHNDVNNYASIRLDYFMNRYMTLGLGGRYVDDNEAYDQTLFFARAILSF